MASRPFNFALAFARLLRGRLDRPYQIAVATAPHVLPSHDVMMIADVVDFRAVDLINNAARLAITKRSNLSSPPS